VADFHGKTALHYAAMRGSTISCRYLLKKHAETGLEDKYQNTPLALAFLCKHQNVAFMLIESGASVNSKAYCDRKDPSTSHFNAPNREDNPNPKIYSLFFLAVKYGWQGVCYLLLEYGFDFRSALEDAMT
jgi:ankyrin repeat protein